MPKANIRERATVERIYPPAVFASDAAQNAAIAGQVVRGVRILSGPDAAGAFDLEPSSRHVGETSGAVFLAPQQRDDGSGEIDRRSRYEEFLDEVLAAARRFGFEQAQAPGPDDARLRGLRQ
jgi:hypothetical protein